MFSLFLNWYEEEHTKFVMSFISILSTKEHIQGLCHVDNQEVC